jgi:hypothetical protein
MNNVRQISFFYLVTLCRAVVSVGLQEVEMVSHTNSATASTAKDSSSSSAALVLSYGPAKKKYKKEKKKKKKKQKKNMRRSDLGCNAGGFLKLNTSYGYISFKLAEYLL